MSISEEQAELDVVIERNMYTIATSEANHNNVVENAKRTIQDCKRRRIELEESRPENVRVAAAIARMEKQIVEIRSLIKRNLDQNKQHEQNISEITAAMCGVEHAHMMLDSRDGVCGYDSYCIRCGHFSSGPSTMAGFNPKVRKVKSQN